MMIIVNQERYNKSYWSSAETFVSPWKRGVLVKEKEGKRFGGVIIELDIEDTYSQVKVQWTDGTCKVYKNSFLEIIFSL
jgi:hypothetical protein